MTFKDKQENFYIQHLLYHVVGHHVDWYFRHWSRAVQRS